MKSLEDCRSLLKAFPLSSRPDSITRSGWRTYAPLFGMRNLDGTFQQGIRALVHRDESTQLFGPIRSATEAE
jgi:hypothetical protein